MPENPEEDNEKRPAPDSGDITIGELRKLEKAAEAGDVSAQKRLAEIEGVESYEQCISLSKSLMLGIQASDVANAGILSTLKALYDPAVAHMSTVASLIDRNVIAPGLVNSVSAMQDTIAKVMSPYMDGVIQNAIDTLKVSTAPWVEDIEKQTALMSPALSHLAEMAAEKNATFLDAERMLQLTEAASQPIAQLQQGLSDKLGVNLSVIADGPIQDLAHSVSGSLKGVQPSAAELAGLTLRGQDLLGAGKVPEQRLETAFLVQAYVSPQERLLGEILAELRSQRRRTEKNTRRPSNRTASRQLAPSRSRSVVGSRGMHLDTQASLERLHEIRMEAIAKHSPVPKKAAAMGQAGITAKTWRRYDPELWARWDDESYIPGK